MEEENIFSKEERQDNRIHIEKNYQGDGCVCKATARNLYETFTCEQCEHKGKRNCISRKLDEIMKPEK